MNKFKQIISYTIILSALQYLSCKSSGEVKDAPPSVVKEVKVGRALAARLIKKFGLVQDIEVTKYINFVGQKFSAISPRQELNFRFGILDTDEINAYACPGGYILVTRGALNLVENEAELAGVLAHEVAHVSLYHSGKFEGKESDEVFIDMIASMMSPGGNIISTVMETAAAEIEKSMLESGRQKDLELQADGSAIIMLADTGYDTSVYPGYLKKLDKAAGNERLTKTHPPVSERVDKLQAYMRENRISGSGGKTYQKRFQQFIEPIKKSNTK